MNTKYAVKNLRSGNLVKDGITGKICYFNSETDAKQAAFSLTRFAVVGEKRDRYIAIEVKAGL